MPADIGQLFPSSDPLAQWMFSLSAVADDLAVLDRLLHQDWDDPGGPTVTNFRLIVARIYEGERVVVAMDSHVEIASFLADVSKATDSCSILRASYRRDLSIAKKAEQSLVERTFSRARHLTVHYPQGAELARILRAARHLEVRLWSRREPPALRYLWAQDVMEHAIWPGGAQHRPEVDLAHNLTQAFVGVFKHALNAYLERVDVGAADVARLSPDDTATMPLLPD